MKPSVKAKWLRALRSGKYKQGTGMLRSADNSYCCLGVLCDLYKKKTWISDEGLWAYGDKGIYAYPPLFVRKAADLDYTGNRFVSTLAAMNDGGKSFSEIADWIEKNL